MGIFSSKKKTITDTQVSRLMDDDAVPNPILEAVMDSILFDTDMVENIIAALLNGPHRKIEKAYRYAERGDYFYGLPDINVLSNTGSTAELIAVIQAQTGRVITLDYARMDDLNYTHVGYQELVANHGYVHSSNQLGPLTATKGTPVYLDHMVPYIRPNEDLNSDDENDADYVDGAQFWEGSTFRGFTPFRPTRSDPAVQAKVEESAIVYLPLDAPDSDVRIDVHYTWRVNGVDNFDVFTIDLSSFNHHDQYFHARYFYTDGGQQKVDYFTYLPDGTHPTIDATLDVEYTTPGSYFPFALFRTHRDNRAAAHHIGTPEYETTKKMVGFYGMDYAAVSTDLHNNGDINDLDHAVLKLAVPIISEDKADVDYLFRYFKDIADEFPEVTGGGVQMAKVSSWFSFPVYVPNKYAFDVTDGGYRTRISMTDCNYFRRAGSIGPVGTLTNTYVPNSGNAGILGKFKQRGYRSFKKQISPNVYEEVNVVSLHQTYYMYGGYATEAGFDSPEMLIPVDFNIARQMSPQSRNRLYTRGLHFVFNYRKRIKIKWYQRSIFKKILKVLSIVLIIVSFGYATPIALTLAGLSAAAIAIVKILLRRLIFQLILTEVAKAVGFEAAAILATIATVAGVAKGYQAGGIGESEWAQTLLQVGNGLQAGASEVLQRQGKELYDDIQEHDEWQRRQWEKLDEAQESLNSGIDVDPMGFIGQRPITVFGESPADFYNRTIHLGNPAATSFEMLHSYYDIKKTLPKFNDAVGGYS